MRLMIFFLGIENITPVLITYLNFGPIKQIGLLDK